MARVSSVEGCVNGTDLHRPLPAPEFMNSFKSRFPCCSISVEAKKDVVLVLACGSNEVGEVRVLNGRQRMQIQRDFLVKLILSHGFVEL
ncbi:AAA-ATPase [Senna tora]|uniref:AAA-ATPase n=1 Tax=Senna tora TaxID=362788 RepID=A0A834W0H5_9FABA|nr:AAA-ATPase [Senna tora]